MTDERVRPIREDVTTSPRKQQFLDYIAQRYDELAADGGEPVCMVFALVGESGKCFAGYITAPHIQECNTMHIAKGIMNLNADYNDWTRA